MTDALIASRAHATPYGLVHLDASLPDTDRYVTALAEAVQQSGIADRIGMLTSPTAGFRKVLDAFLARREVLEIRHQPIVALNSMEAVGYETLCRPSPAVASIDGVVEAAVATGRTVELDRLIFERVLERTARLDPIPPHVTINLLPASLADSWFESKALATRCRAAGLLPSSITLDRTEQQSAPDLAALAKRVRQLRRQGFGFAVDDAGAGYASFALIAALRPSLVRPIARSFTA
ncbi:MAG: EAL domain-containing protein [Chloroflexi bacterium]|nr:EAL domain-containing protein [Chloroflexota bacterium]